MLLSQEDLASSKQYALMADTKIFIPFKKEAPHQRHKMTMDIIDFDLEPRSNSTGKCSDYLEVIDGEYIHDDVIFGPQCGPLDVFHLRTFDKKVFIVWVIQNQF